MDKKPIDKLTRWPADWMAVIERLATADDVDVSAKIRSLTLAGLPASARRGLSPNPTRGLGGGRKPSD